MQSMHAFNFSAPTALLISKIIVPAYLARMQLYLFRLPMRVRWLPTSEPMERIHGMKGRVLIYASGLVLA